MLFVFFRLSLSLGLVKEMKFWVLPKNEASFVVVHLCFDSLVISVIGPCRFSEVPEE
jgi:hypothetical protein